MARKSRKNAVIEQPNIFQIAQFIRTAQYIRLSVEDSNNKGNSIENQKLLLDDFIANNPNMKLFDTYIDNGATGTNYNRPEFQRMIEDIENGKIDCVIVKDLSRLGRNSIDTGYYIETYFYQKKIRFISVNDDFDTANPKQNDGMMLYLKNIINEAYAMDIGKKIKTQARQAMRDGQYVSARPRYGYLKDPNDCHKLIVNPETAPVVKMIFEWFVDGVSTNEIALKLTAMDIPTPSVYGYNKGYITTKKSVGRGQWQTRTIQQLLKQEIYTGKLVQGKTDTIAKKQMHRDKSEWIVVENTHEAIISQELFDAAQERMRLLKERQDSLTINPYSENIWKGKIFCGDCGRALHRQRKKFKTKADGYYLYCLTNTRYERGGCNNSCIPEDELLQAVITSISMQASVLVNKKQLVLYSLTDRQQAEARKAEIASLKQFIGKNQNYLNSLYESLVNNIITAEEYQSMRKDYGDKISDAVKKIHNLETVQSEAEKKYNYYCDLSDAVEKIVKNNALTKELIGKLIDKIYVYKGRKVEIIYNFENEYESEVATNA